MRVRDLDPADNHADLPAGDFRLDHLRGLFSENHQPAQITVLHIKNIIHFLFGNHQGMPLFNRTDIQKRQIIVIFQNLVARDIAADNFCEDRRHVLSFPFHPGSFESWPD